MSISRELAKFVWDEHRQLFSDFDPGLSYDEMSQLYLDDNDASSNFDTVFRKSMFDIHSGQDWQHNPISFQDYSDLFEDMDPEGSIIEGFKFDAQNRKGLTQWFMNKGPSYFADVGAAKDPRVGTDRINRFTYEQQARRLGKTPRTDKDGKPIPFTDEEIYKFQEETQKAYAKRLKEPSRDAQATHFGGKVGDILTSGAPGKDESKNTLRASFVHAGYDDIAHSAEQNLQSDTLFEAFSWVPDGYGLGPENALHKLNKQHNMLRFGMEELYQPRVDAEISCPHPIPSPWSESKSMKQLTLDFRDIIDRENVKKSAVTSQRKRPIHLLDDAYNTLQSSKGLNRNGVFFTRPIVDIRDHLYNREDPPLKLRNKRLRENLRGTWTTFH